jgi:hypothetical protein
MATPFRATVAAPSARKKCQSSGLPASAPPSEPTSAAKPRLTLLGRGAFAVVFIGLELAGIAWGQRAPDHVVGFQMFNESSRISIRLFREVQRKRKRVLVELPNGTWSARDARGKLRRYAWSDRVRATPLYVLGQSVHAPYGLDAQLFRLRAALQDVASHIPEDTSTLALVAQVETIKNGRPGPLITLRADRP